MSLGHVRPSVLIMSVLAGALSITACQPKSDAETNQDDSIQTEEAVPMSAEPADPNVTILETDDPSESEVADDTVANINTERAQINYLCSPELKVQATYEEDDVILATDKGTLTLGKTNDGTNPEVYEADSALDGSEGFTQWRVAHAARDTGVMRMAGADASKVSTYDCNKTQ
ncbi:hypothetical protein [Psychrobacter sp. 16-MNA-CIBAN-0192]|uniref:hypothetical protein n=1 Tax=Psychrobacter sp. 16-MNA-CIBAN-0192 TaxID=3140448 RepID=UPI00332FA96A